MALAYYQQRTGVHERVLVRVDSRCSILRAYLPIYVRAQLHYQPLPLLTSFEAVTAYYAAFFLITEREADKIPGG